MADDQKICLQNVENSHEHLKTTKISSAIVNANNFINPDSSEEMNYVGIESDFNTSCGENLQQNMPAADSKLGEPEHVFCHVGVEKGHTPYFFQSEDNEDEYELFSDTGSKRLKLNIPQNHYQHNGNNTFFTTSPTGDTQSPDCKRKRIHHDYRRLSSSGYVDDYENGKDNRFTSPTDADILPISPGRSKSVSPRTKSPVNNSKLMFPETSTSADINTISDKYSSKF